MASYTKIDVIEVEKSRKVSIRPRAPRFRLRALLAVTTLLCIWLGVEVKRAREQEFVVAAIHQVGGEVHYSYQYDADGNFKQDAAPWAPAWLRRAVGENLFVTVVGVDLSTSPARGGGVHNYNSHVDDALVEKLAALKRLRYLTIRAPQLGDAGLATISGFALLERLDLWSPLVSDVGVGHLAALRQLKQLSIATSRMSDASMRDVARMRTLERLTLRGAGITNAGLIGLADLPNLQSLTLYGDTMRPIAGTQIDEGGLQHLEKLTRLEELWISNMQIHHSGLASLQRLSQLKVLHLHMCNPPFEGLAKLQQALPNCHINADSGAGFILRSP